MAQTTSRNKLKARQLNTGAMQELVDFFYPVGTGFYIQFPVANSNDLAVAFPVAKYPTALYGGTWAAQFTTEGIFFKTEGDPLTQTDGENNLRTTGLQTDAGQGGQVGGVDTGNTYWMMSTNLNNSISIAANPTYTVFQGNTGNQGNAKMAKLMNDGTNGNIRQGKETRGRNRFIKVWRRTA